MKKPPFTPALRQTGPRSYDVVARAEDGSYELSKRAEGYRLDINDCWVPKLEKLWRQYAIEEVSLGGPLGWNQPDISFLLDLPRFRRLVLHPANELAWQTLGTLSHLEVLRVITAPCRPAEDVNFANLEKLRQVELPWWPEFKSVLWNKRVQSLTLKDAKRLPELDCQRMAELVELRLIRCRDCRNAALTENHSLVSLELSVCPKLEIVAPSTALGTLEYLLLHGPLRWDYQQIRNFPRLRQLTLHDMGKIPTLSFLGLLTELEYVAFSIGTTVADGDLQFLDKLPKLMAASYDKSQPHYFPKRPQDWWEGLKKKREAAGWNF